QIDEEYKRLANSGQLLSLSQSALYLLADGEDQNIVSLLYSARNQLTELAELDSKMNDLIIMLDDASIQISEASDELRHYSERLDMDPNRLF
ncbi:hypothetical protein NYY91_18740, partial [Acinetobacter baumannii]|nr:hypothetical protein [Acinetobacter baumannii]